MSFWIINIVLVFLLCVIFSWVLIPNILLISFKKNLFDELEERKVHQEKTPRLGGIAFKPAIFISISLILGINFIIGEQITFLQEINNIPELLLGFSACAILYLVGIADDLVGVRYRAKFVFQILCSVILIVGGVSINNLYGIFGIHEIPNFIAYPMSVFIIIFIINSINLIDGIDGLAAGISGVVFLIYGLTFIYSQQWIFAMLAFASLGVLIPFFYYNVFGKAIRKQKIFMGDTGSLTLGIILCILSLKILRVSEDTSALPNPAVLAFAPLIIPCFDLIWVFIHRIYMKKNPFLADKSHIHHRLLNIGMNQRTVMILIISGALLLALSNIFLSKYFNVSVLIVVNIIIWILFNIYLTSKSKRYNSRTIITSKK